MKCSGSYSTIALVAVAILTAAQSDWAQAQYGGQRSGTVFGSPKDVRSSTRLRQSEQPSGSTASNDPYDPAVWQSRRGSRADRRKMALQTASNARQARLASHLGQAEESVEVAAGEVVYEVGGPPAYSDGGCDSCDSGCCGGSRCGGGCGEGACGDCGHCIRCICIPFPRPQYLEVSLGVTGFKGPADVGQSVAGSFGFSEAVNLGGRLPFTNWTCNEIGYQLGYRAVQSNLHGTTTSGDIRSQSFFTVGLFEHNPVGLQYGVAWDWLRDEYNMNMDISQLRAQLSVVSPRGNEIGALVAIGTKNDKQNNSLYEATDQFRFFYRKPLDCGGDLRFFGGFTGEQDGLVGFDGVVPLCECWDLAFDATYLIPDEDNGLAAASDEAWNLGIHFVWNIRGGSRSNRCNPYRPMFNVADNGSFIIGQPTN